MNLFQKKQSILIVVLLVMLIVLVFSLGTLYQESLTPSMSTVVEFPNFNIPPNGLLVQNGIIQDEYFQKVLFKIVNTAYENGSKYTLTHLLEDIRKQVDKTGTFLKIVNKQYGGIKKYLESQPDISSLLEKTSQR